MSMMLAAVAVEALRQSGVRHVVLAPGSRNAPLSLVLHDAHERGQVELHVRVDERVAGFLALGLAKATGDVVAVVTTSGSATANLAPAAMEARAAGVGLLLLTADRPSELVGTGANQVGRQVGILGDSALDVVRLSSQSGGLHTWAAAVNRAWATASGIRTRQAGPVQINLEFSPPLVGEVPSPAVRVPNISASTAANEVVELEPGPRTVVLAGDATPEVGAEARACAELAGVPLLAEPSSNARAGSCAVPRYTLALAGELGSQVERVVVFGHPTLSRPVTALLSRADVEVVVVSAAATWHDLGSRAVTVADRVLLPPGDPEWLRAWDTGPQPPHGLWDGRCVAEVVLQALIADDVLMIGSSSPIRDADCAPIAAHPPTVYANRGLSGIDGTVATASGLSLGLNRRVTVLLGDLTAQHDLGAFVRPTLERRPDLRLVIVDDDGGAIFHRLEQGAPEYAEAFERAFGTPQGLDWPAITRALGWNTVEVRDREALTAALASDADVIVAKVTRG